MSQQIEPAELADRLRQDPPPHLLDVREPDEHALVALPHARLIPLGDLALRIDELADWRTDSRDIVVYCHHGIRSRQAITLLRTAGFTRLLNLRGGIDRWAVDVDPDLARY